jgi:hypothetical protein
MQSSNNVFAGIGNNLTKSNNVSAAASLVSSSGPSPLEWNSPAPVQVAFGTTTGSVTLLTPTGGTAPYTYSAIITYDSTGNYTSYISSISGQTINLAALTAGQVLSLECTATDSVGNIIDTTATIIVASAAAGTMTPGAFPASQTLASNVTSTSITFNPVGGTFTAPVTYVATISIGAGSVSNVGTDVSLSALVPSGSTLVRLRATDAAARIADAFCLVTVAAEAASPLVYQKVIGFDFRNQGTQSFALGANTVSLTSDDGRSFSTGLNISMGTGSYTTCPDSFSAAGWKRTWASTATGTFLRSRLAMPLGITIGADDDVRVVFTGRFNNAVSANSVYWQVSPTDDASEDAGSVQGMRLLKSGANTALFLRAAGASGAIISQTSSPPCPLVWQDGSTTITMTIFYPRRSTRGIVYMSQGGTPGPQADLGQVGTTPASNQVRPGILGGRNTLYIQHYGSNGAANGLGAQFEEIYTIEVFRRTLP